MPALTDRRQMPTLKELSAFCDISQNYFAEKTEGIAEKNSAPCRYFGMVPYAFLAGAYS